LNTSHKILTPDDLKAWREQARRARQQVVTTNGCFDILHAGHVAYLEAAREQGDLLLIGLNSDTSIRELKGPSRPVNHQDDRARVLAALQCVSAVCVFNEVRATRFLHLAQPDIYVKGGDLTVDQIPSEEREAVAQYGGTIHIMPLVPGRSTTNVIQRIQGH
jgi:rfaE bifunctional protein nucleotidyltransferase chain/domain